MVLLGRGDLKHAVVEACRDVELPQRAGEGELALKVDDDVLPRQEVDDLILLAFLLLFLLVLGLATWLGNAVGSLDVTAN